MVQHIPFYMVYESKLPWDEENLNRRDYDYMKSAYPDTAKRIMPYVEDECDRMQYMGSMMFDEYPDQLQMRLMCRRIYEKAKECEERPGKWLSDLVQVLTYQEIMKRRSEYRKYRKKFY